MKFNHHSIIGLSHKFFAADKGEGTGGGGNKPLSIEDQLTAAKLELTTVQGNLSTLTGERDKLVIERDNLKSQFDELTKTANAHVADLATVRSELATAQGTITSITGERDSAFQNVTRLEALCGVKGIAKTAAVPAAPDAPAMSEADFGTRINSAKTPAERAAIVSEFEKAVADKRI